MEKCDVTTSWEPETISSYNKDDMILLLVGAEEKELHAQGSYLSRYSNFFKAALKKEWTEGQTRTVKLPEERVEVVARYLDFVYDGRLPTDHMKIDYRKAGVYDNLTELYVLGERQLDTKIRNAIISEIIRLTTSASGSVCYFPPHTAIHTIYDSTTENSPARRLMVDFYASGPSSWITSQLHSTFLQDLARVLLAKLESTGKPRENMKLVADNYFIRDE